MTGRAIMTRPCLPTSPARACDPAACQGIGRLELGADRPAWRAAAASCARRLAFHMRQQVVAAGVGRRMPVVGAVELEELAHLVQARVDPEADALLQREVLAVGVAFGRVFVVRREDRVAPLVVARVDDQVHRLFDPLGGLLGAEVVEHEQVRFHHRPQDVHLRGAHERVVGAADHPQQIARVVEEPARAFRRGSRGAAPRPRGASCRCRAARSGTALSAARETRRRTAAPDGRR